MTAKGIAARDRVSPSRAFRAGAGAGNQRLLPPSPTIAFSFFTVSGEMW